MLRNMMPAEAFDTPTRRKALRVLAETLHRAGGEREIVEYGMNPDDPTLEEFTPSRGSDPT